MSIFSEDLLNIVEEKENEKMEHLKKTGEILINMFNGGEPKNINPLTEIPEPQMKLYGYEGFFDSVFFDTEEELKEHIKSNGVSGGFGGELCIVEYMGTMAGRSDVIRKTNKDGKQTLVTVATEDHIGYYNERRSYHQGSFVWEGTPGNLRAIYSAFKKRGIVLENDIYGQEDERRESLMKMLDESDSPVLKKIN